MSVNELNITRKNGRDGTNQIEVERVEHSAAIFPFCMRKITMASQDTSAAPLGMVVVLNWVEELKRLLPR